MRPSRRSDQVCACSIVLLMSAQPACVGMCLFPSARACARLSLSELLLRFARASYAHHLASHLLYRARQFTSGHVHSSLRARARDIASLVITELVVCSVVSFPVRLPAATESSLA